MRRDNENRINMIMEATIGKALMGPNRLTFSLARVMGKLNIHTWCLGRPTIEGKTALGASSPANPALQVSDPSSMTNAAISSSHNLIGMT